MTISENELDTLENVAQFGEYHFLVKEEIQLHDFKQKLYIESILEHQ